MIPILSAQQIREADLYTIENEPIASIDLMERASIAFVDQLVKTIIIDGGVHIFCGVGNNGGDGLAVSRLLSQRGLLVRTYVVGDIAHASDDFNTNLQRINNEVTWVDTSVLLPDLSHSDIVIDAMFGSGLSRKIEGQPAAVIRTLNESPGIKVALDIASGLYADHAPEQEAVIFEPDFTITFQIPKWSFFQPSFEKYVGQPLIVDIGLDQNFIKNQPSNYFYTQASDIRSTRKKRDRFSHKGDFGRLLIIAGSHGKMGAAVMTTKASFRSGAGLVFVCTPRCGVEILQNQMMEAMVLPCSGQFHVEDLVPLASYDVIAIGPGLGQAEKTVRMFDQLLSQLLPHQKLLIDADGINILAQNPEWIARLPFGTILTPHPGEFKRLVGGWRNEEEKLSKLHALSKKHQINVVLKGAYSAVADLSGNVFFNSTGNPGMATAGSGDVLTGVIAGLLCTGLSPFSALRAGVFIHGLAGDKVAEEMGERSLMAGDLISALSKAFKVYF